MNDGGIRERRAVIRILRQAEDLDCLNDQIIKAAVMTMVKDLSSVSPRDRARGASVIAQFCRLGLLASKVALEIEQDMIAGEVDSDSDDRILEAVSSSTLKVSFIHDEDDA